MKKNILINENTLLKDALKALDITAEKVLIVTGENGTMVGTVTDGDIRRALLAGTGMYDSIKHVYNPNPIFLYHDSFTLDEAKKTFIGRKIELIPLIDRQRRVVDYISWSEVFKNGKVAKRLGSINCPVVIMAGGKGVRLDPFTRVLPKPLIPIGDKPIIEIIMDNFGRVGVEKFYLSINYKGDMIKSYFAGIQNGYQINYVHEEDFLGTAGSLKNIENELEETFIVSNCDVLVNARYDECLGLHKANKAKLTLITAVHHFCIPYGVVDFSTNGKVKKVIEKPEFTNTVNTGVYILDRSVLKLIPLNTVFHMTDLIAALLAEGDNVFSYPVNEKEFVDVGQLEDYKKTLTKFHMFGLT